MIATMIWLLYTSFLVITSTSYSNLIYQDPIYTQIDPWIDQLYHHDAIARQPAIEALVKLAHQSPELTEAVIVALSLVLADRRWQNPLTLTQQAIWTDLIQLIAKLPPTPASIALLIDELHHPVWHNGYLSYPAAKALSQIGSPACLPVKTIICCSATPHQRLLAQQVLSTLSCQSIAVPRITNMKD